MQTKLELRVCVLFKILFVPAFAFRFFLGINPSTGSKIAKSKDHKVRSGVHEAVLSLVKEFAFFNELEH